MILVPTRELAVQVEAAFGQYGKGSGLRGTAIYGGAGMPQQIMKLRRGVDIIVATPGRLFDHLEQGYVDLSEVTMFVLDEADRMLDMGFLPQVQRIAKHLPTEGRQTMLFSATMDGDVEVLARTYLTDPAIINAGPRSTVVAQIEQIVHRVTPGEKGDLLLTLLHEAREGGGGALVFARTRHGADRLEKTLSQAGLRSGCIHGDISQNQRERVSELSSAPSGWTCWSPPTWPRVGLTSRTSRTSSTTMSPSARKITSTASGAQAGRDAPARH